MEIRHYSELEKMLAGTHPIRRDAPEVLLLERLCAGDAEGVCALFPEKKLFGGAPAVDMPYGRFEGLEEIRRFAGTWHERFGAESSRPVPCVQTTAGGRSVLEVSVNFLRDGAIDQVPMFAVADYGAPGLLEEVRFYVPADMIPGYTPYRPPIFKAERLEPGDPALLTGAVREYYEALHTYPRVDVERVLACTGEGAVLGGYRYWEPEKEEDGRSGRERLRAAYTMMSEYIPGDVAMRYETVIDDGRTGVLEWVHVLSRRAVEVRGRLAMSGIAAYERGEDGLLCSIRILDYANRERSIDWSRLSITKAEAEKVNVRPE